MLIPRYGLTAVDEFGRSAGALSLDMGDNSKEPDESFMNMKKYVCSLSLIAVFTTSTLVSALASDLTATRTLEGHTDSVWSVAFSPDGKKVLSGSWDDTAKLWDIQTGKIQRTQKFSSWANWVAFSPNGKDIIVSSLSIQMWDARTGALKRTIKVPNWVSQPIAFSPKGETLAIGIGEGRIRLIDGQTDKAKVTLKSPDKQEEIMFIAFSPNGELVASATSKLTYKRMYDPVGMVESGTVKLWSARSGKLLRTLKGHETYVQSVAFAPDGKSLASGSSDGTVKMWNVNSGLLQRTLKGDSPFDGVFSVAFSPDGKILASGGASLRLWSTATGKRMNTLKGHSNNIHSIAFSPNGKMLVSGSWDNTLKIWNIP